jgi:hypothetical protein
MSRHVSPSDRFKPPGASTWNDIVDSAAAYRAKSLGEAGDLPAAPHVSAVVVDVSNDTGRLLPAGSIVMIGDFASGIALSGLDYDANAVPVFPAMLYDARNAACVPAVIITPLSPRQIGRAVVSGIVRARVLNSIATGVPTDRLWLCGVRDGGTVLERGYFNLNAPPCEILRLNNVPLNEVGDMLIRLNPARSMPQPEERGHAWAIALTEFPFSYSYSQVAGTEVLLDRGTWDLEFAATTKEIRRSAGGDQTVYGGFGFEAVADGVPSGVLYTQAFAGVEVQIHVSPSPFGSGLLMDYLWPTALGARQTGLTRSGTPPQDILVPFDLYPTYSGRVCAVVDRLVRFSLWARTAFQVPSDWSLAGYTRAKRIATIPTVHIGTLLAGSVSLTGAAITGEPSQYQLTATTSPPTGGSYRWHKWTLTGAVVSTELADGGPISLKIISVASTVEGSVTATLQVAFSDGVTKSASHTWTFPTE